MHIAYHDACIKCEWHPVDHWSVKNGEHKNSSSLVCATVGLLSCLVRVNGEVRTEVNSCTSIGSVCGS